jgi:TatA/E family protein of Tat protein translocase
MSHSRIWFSKGPFMFGISFEHLLIVGVILIFVGPKRLPELGMTFGRALKNFKDSIGGIEQATYKRVEEVKEEVKRPTTASTAASPPANTQPPEAYTSHIPLESTPVTPSSGPTGAAMATGNPMAGNSAATSSSFEATQTDQDTKPKSST